MKSSIVAAATSAVCAGLSVAAIRPSEAARLSAAAQVVRDLRDTVQTEVWNRARCVVVVPDLKKAAFIAGGEYGKGVMSCRAGAAWSAPSFLEIGKGSLGFQAGAEQIDLVLLVMNEQGVQKLLQDSTTLGADASVAAGPLGAQGQVATDARGRAEIFSFSRARGAFAGIDLSGGVVRPDVDANRAVYGARATPRTILAMSGLSAPTEAASLLQALGSVTSPTPTSPAAASQPTSPTSTGASAVADSDLRAGIVEIEQALDRILAEATPAGAAVGTSGTSAAAGSAMVVVDRSRLVQVRQRLEAMRLKIDRGPVK